MPLDPQAEQLMNMVKQVESLPPEVLDVVLYRKNQSEKQNKKMTNEQKDEMSQMYDLMEKFKLQQPIQAPASQQNPVQAMLGASLGEIDPGLLV